MTIEELKNLSVTELQALAYQQVLAKTQADRSLQIIESILNEKQTPVTPETPASE